MVRNNFRNLQPLKTPLRTIIAFEDFSNDANKSGIYFLVLDKNMVDSNSAALLDSAIRIITASDYGNKDIERIYLYSDNDGVDVSLAYVIKPDPGSLDRHVFVGKVKNNQFIACDGGAPSLLIMKSLDSLDITF